MRCRHCNYLLWNIRPGVCPECGQPFKPSDFQFLPNAVRFCCPHCDQAYYGTSPTGLLVPPTFQCVSCARDISIDEMVLRPAEGVPDQLAEPEIMPWLDRAQRGLISAFIATIYRSLLRPMRLIRAVPAESTLGQAFGFAILVHLIAGVVAALPLCAVMVAPAAMSGSPKGAVAVPLLGVAGTGIALVIALPFLAQLLWILATHAMLRITGPTPHTLCRTAQAILYSTGANSISAIPCFGIYIGWIWWTISGVLMVREAQRTSGLRATLCTILLPLGLVLSIIAGYVALTVSAMSLGAAAARSGMITTMPPGANAGTAAPATGLAMIGRALQDYGAEHAGKLPAHPIALATGNPLTPQQFLVDGTLGEDRDVQLQGMPLEQFQYKDEKQQEYIVQRLAGGADHRLVAARVGDFVFTYFGIESLDAADPGLWTVVCPARPGNLNAAVVIHADGTIETFDPGEWPAALVGQNELRAKFGLPALQDPLPANPDTPQTTP